MRAVRRAVLVVILLTVSGCSEGTRCGQTDAAAVPGLSIEVHDAQAVVCDATVTAVDGDYSVALKNQSPSSAVCPYVGAWGRAGTYTITVVSGERSKTVTGVVVGEDACHVMTRKVTVILD